MPKKKRTFNLRSFVTQALRRAWMKSPERYAVKARASHPKKRGWFVCENCKKKCEKVIIDHIAPVVDTQAGFIDYNTLVLRMFCPVEGLMAICSSCSEKKTKAENVIRRASASTRRKQMKEAAKDLVRDMTGGADD